MKVSKFSFICSDKNKNIKLSIDNANSLNERYALDN